MLLTFTAMCLITGCGTNVKNMQDSDRILPQPHNTPAQDTAITPTPQKNPSGTLAQRDDDRDDDDAYDDDFDDDDDDAYDDDFDDDDDAYDDDFDDDDD